MSKLDNPSLASCIYLLTFNSLCKVSDPFLEMENVWHSNMKRLKLIGAECRRWGGDGPVWLLWLGRGSPSGPLYKTRACMPIPRCTSLYTFILLYFYTFSYGLEEDDSLGPIILDHFMLWEPALVPHPSYTSLYTYSTDPDHHPFTPVALLKEKRRIKFIHDQ